MAGISKAQREERERLAKSGLKRCSKSGCGEIKSVNEFGADKSKWDKKQTFCRVCHNAKSNQSRWKTPEAMAAYREQKEERARLAKLGLKQCLIESGCGEVKPVSEFNKRAASEDGLNNYCRQCMNRRNKEYYEENKEARTEYYVQYQYGLSQADYNNLLAQQNNRCAICRGENKDGSALHIDHNHSCCKGRKSCGKCVRELLCGHCNKMLGYARDNPETLKAAQNYLERHSRPKNLEIISQGD